MTDASTTKTDKGRLKAPLIVGIGASAGGLEALQQFFQQQLHGFFREFQRRNIGGRDRYGQKLAEQRMLCCDQGELARDFHAPLPCRLHESERGILRKAEHCVRTASG